MCVCSAERGSAGSHAAAGIYGAGFSLWVIYGSGAVGGAARSQCLRARTALPRSDGNLTEYIHIMKKERPMSFTFRTYAAAAALALAIPALAVPAMASDIEVRDAYARSASPAAKTGAAFMQIVNK